MSDNKTLPQCDCINDCGDDDNVAKGLRQRCSRYDEIQAENLDNEALRLLSNAMRSKLAASRRKGRSAVCGVDVQHRKVGRGGGEGRQRRRAVRIGADVIALLLQRDGDRGQDVLIVVDESDGRHDIRA